MPEPRVRLGVFVGGCLDVFLGLFLGLFLGPFLGIFLGLFLGLVYGLLLGSVPYLATLSQFRPPRVWLRPKKSHPPELR